MTKISGYYDHELQQFTHAMRYKLHVHRAKGKWEGKDLDELFKLLVGEVEELRETISDGNQIALILEAADVANYALIIANVAMKIAAGRTENTPPPAIPYPTELRTSSETHNTKPVKIVPLTIADLANAHASHLKAAPEEIEKAIKL